MGWLSQGLFNTQVGLVKGYFVTQATLYSYEEDMSSYTLQDGKLIHQKGIFQ